MSSLMLVDGLVEDRKYGSVLVQWDFMNNWTTVHTNKGLYVCKDEGDWLTQITDAIRNRRMQWASNEKSAIFLYADEKGRDAKGFIYHVDLGTVKVPSPYDQHMMEVEKARRLEGIMKRAAMKRREEQEAYDALKAIAMADAKKYPAQWNPAPEAQAYYAGGVNKKHAPTPQIPSSKVADTLDAIDWDAWGNE